MVWGYIATAAISLYAGYRQSRSLRAGGAAARAAAFANALDLRNLAGKNAEAYLAAGAYNAASLRRVGEANAINVENTTARNILMHSIQYEEERRRFVLNQKMTAGGIRARVGASGVQTNTGTPQDYLYAQVRLSIQERRFGDIRSYWTIRNMQEEGMERAALIRLTADENASVVEFNAMIEAEMSMLEAERQATAMERGGELALQGAHAQASGALWSGISNAVQAGIGAYAAYNPPQSTSFSDLSFGNVWSNQSQVGGSTSSYMYMNPFDPSPS